LPLPGDSVDLVFCSPPYEDRRTYGIGFGLTGDAWVQWTADRFVEACRVSRGLVAFVVDGKTKGYRYSCTPELLMAELARRGVCVRRPVYYKRHGIPGSGGPDWLANKVETVVCGTRERGRLSWSDPTACGSPPKFAPGGQPTHRLPNGRRVDLVHTKRTKNGVAVQGYTAPKVANPGNVVECRVGGGNIGHKLAHENEAPFPLALAEFFVRSFCPPWDGERGIVCDPFCGSGTTGHAALKWGRAAELFDIRESQVELTKRRMSSVKSDALERMTGERAGEG